LSVTAAKGFAAGAVHCGIRKKERLDLALVHSLVPATGAGMFTVNRVQAAPVAVSREHLELAQPQAIVANSGVANAATGEAGIDAARVSAKAAAAKLGIAEEEVLVLSTGVIGQPLPVDRVLSGITRIVVREDGGPAAAEAIMTTDTHSKESVAHGPGFTVGGMAKGSGMIHPQMATMLAVLTTDYPLEPGEAIEFLRPAVDASFNAISVDGECSTNDTVLLLANGASGCARDDDAFAAALRTVCGELAKQIVADGEGATVIAEIAVRGAATDGEARAIAERVATSPLVKTALHGHDANWGRIAAAAGSAKHDGGFAALDPDRLSIVIDGVPVLVGGVPSGDEPALANGHCEIELDLALGTGAASYLTTDLSYDYVRINAEYRS
jgi:glutamate N-acetyltransferase/amino-acid N-acetyltransferase